MPVLEFEDSKIAYFDSGLPVARGASLGGRAVKALHGAPCETVVLLHCTASSSAQWHAFVSAYSQAFRVIAVDLYGHGASSAWPGTRPITLADEARAVAAVIASLDGPVHLVGHSYGGAVALHVALTRPEHLRSLSMIEPVAFYLLRSGAPQDFGYFREVNDLAQRISSAVVSGDYATGMARFVDFWNGPGAWDSLSAEKRHALCKAVGVVALNFWTTMTDSTRRTALCGLRVPTLVVEGARSRPESRRICELLRATLPKTRSAIIPEAGHMAPLSHPAAVNAVIARHAHRQSDLADVPLRQQPNAA